MAWITSPQEPLAAPGGVSGGAEAGVALGCLLEGHTSSGSWWKHRVTGGQVAGRATQCTEAGFSAQAEGVAAG